MSKKWIFLALFLPSCIRVGPDFKAPETNVEQAWTEKSNAITSIENSEIKEWWKDYQDETLNGLVESALSGNYTLEAAAYRIIAARANLGIAIGEFFPQTQQAEGSLIRTHLSKNAPNTANADRDYWDGILGFRVIWEIDFWGRFYRGIQAAYGEYTATQEDYRDVQRLLISDVVLNYVQVKTFQRRIAILEHNIAIQHRSAEIAKIRWEGGYESELDYAQAVALWKETAAQKVSLEIELKRVLTSLAILVGLTPEEFLLSFTICPEPLNIPTNATIGYPAEILCQRPDLRRSLDLLYAQSARIGIAISDLLPRISFTGFIGLECASDTHSTANDVPSTSSGFMGLPGISSGSSKEGKHFFSRDSLTFFYGPSFVWPILNYGRLENRVKEQYAILNQGIALYRNQVVQAYKEVEDALTFFAKSLEETADLEQSFKHAKRSVDISILQYQEGLADYTRVLNSLQLQVAAEDAIAQAIGNIGLAYANIFKSLGTF